LLGAAGCGYEYRNTNGLCGHLISDGDTFMCLKYLENLKKHNITGHPFRCDECRGKVDAF